MALDIGELNGYLSLDISDFTGKIKDALGSLKSKDWKKAGAAAGAVAATSLAAGFASEVKMDAAVKRTSAQLGLTKGEAEKAGKAAGALYRDGLGESMSEVSDATGAVIGAFEGMRTASQEEIEGLSRAALQFSSVMGVDVPGAARTAGVLVQSGLAESGQEAFDLLTAASQKAGPDMVQPLMDATNEYAKHFAMLGYDGQQAMSVLADAAMRGQIGVDKAGDAVKEFGIRASDLNDTGAQETMAALGLSGRDMANALLAGGERAQGATRQIIQALLNVEDPAERARLASGLFGTQIEDIGKDQLPGFLTALADTQGGLGDVAGATQAMGDTMAGDVSAKITRFSRAVQSELMALAEPAVDWLTPMLDGLSGFSRYTVPVVGALAALAAATAAASVASTVYNGVLAVQRGYTAAAAAVQWALNSALLASPITWVVLAVGALVAALILFFTKTETGRKVWAAAWGGIKAAAGAVGAWFAGTLWPLMKSVWDGIAGAALWLWRTIMVPAWNGIRAAISAVGGWITGTLVPWLQGAWDAIASAASWLWQSVIVPVWQGIKTAIALVVAAVMTYAQAWVALFRNVVAPVFRWLWRSVIQPAWQGIRAAISAIVEWFRGSAWPTIQRVIGYIRTGFGLMRDGLRVIWAAVRDAVIRPVIDWLTGTVWRRIDSFIGNVRRGFEVMRDGLRAVWTAIRDRVIRPVADWIVGTLVGRIRTATDRIKAAFNTMRDGVARAWGAVKSAATAPVRFVVETVINGGIIANFNKIAGAFGVKKLPSVSVGFASGGVLPGYTPGRDIHSFYSPQLGRLDLSGGEAIMRPEFTRAMGGPAGIARLNYEAVNGTLRTDAFATGGVWSPRRAYAGGGVIDWLKDKAQLVTAAVKDPKGFLGKIAEHLLGRIPAGGLMGEIAIGMARKIASSVGSHLLGAGTSGGAVPAVTGTGRGGSLAWADAVARKHGLTMTSGYRPGARTSSGSLSMHGLGRAHDYSNGVNTPEERAFFLEILRGSRPTELLFTPMGALNVHRGGRQYPNSGTVARIHWNHVHVAYKSGGVLGDAVGSGYRAGTLSASPGWHMVGEDGPELIRFRGGEQVKNTADTTRALGDGAPSIVNNFYEVGGDAAEIAATRVQNRMLLSARRALSW